MPENNFVHLDAENPKSWSLRSSKLEMAWVL
jgi:hypothetical protein